MTDYSEKFYGEYADRYAEVARQLLQSVYIESSHPGLTCDLDLLARLKELAPGKCGLDAGCGAGARDVYSFFLDGYEMSGIDAVPENIDVASRLHPEIADNISVADLREKLPFPSASFDFVMCNAVIQHIEPDLVKTVTLPELARVLRKDGILQLMFKNGSGLLTVYDKDYGVDRTFRLYDENEILDFLDGLGLDLIESESEEQLGGIMFFTDPKPSPHCVFQMRKR